MVMVIGPQARASKLVMMIEMIFDFMGSFLIEDGMCSKKVPEFYARGGITEWF